MVKKQNETRPGIEFILWNIMLGSFCILFGWAYKLIKHSMLLAKNWRALEVVKPQINSGLKWILALSVGFISMMYISGVFICFVRDTENAKEQNFKDMNVGAALLLSPILFFIVLHSISAAFFWKKFGFLVNVVVTTFSFICVVYCLILTIGLTAFLNKYLGETSIIPIGNRPQSSDNDRGGGDEDRQMILTVTTTKWKAQRTFIPERYAGTGCSEHSAYEQQLEIEESNCEFPLNSRGFNHHDSPNTKFYLDNADLKDKSYVKK